MSAYDDTAAFWAELRRHRPVEPDPVLQQQVAAGLERVRTAWPSSGGRLERFLRHWARQAARGGSVGRELQLIQVEDLYLAFACAEGDAAAIAHLKARVIPRVLPAVRTVDPSETFRSDIEQLLLARVLVAEPERPARIAEYAGRGSLEHWLRAVALRLALNRRRDASRVPDVAWGDVLPEVAASAGAPELELLRSRYVPQVSAALQRALAALPSQERNVLRLHYLDGLSLNQVGAVYQVNKSTVSRWLLRARERLLEDARQELETSLGIGGPELDSLLRAMGSALHLSLSRALGPDAPSGPSQEVP